MNNSDRAKALFAAFTSSDAEAVRELCAADLRATQNGGPPMTLESLITFAQAAHRVLHGYRYDDVVRSSTPTGFVEEHTLHGVLPDGSDFRLPVCVVGDVESGKVVALREYFDTAAARGLAEVLAHA